MPGKILRRAAAWLLALTVVLTLVPGEGRAVLDGVYLTAANEQLMELNSETMPFYSGGVLYVSSKLFEGTDLGINYVYNSTMDLAMLYTNRTDLRFDLAAQTTYDKNGNYYQAHAIEKNGYVFVPLGTVCGFFGLSWNINGEAVTGTAPLIRVRSSSAILSDREFIDAAASEMRRRYTIYEKQVQDAASSGGEDTPVPTYTGQKIHLLVECRDREDTLAAVKALGTSAQATFLLTAEQMSDGDLLRALVAGGHGVALLVTGETEEAIEEQVLRGRELLWQGPGPAGHGAGNGKPGPEPSLHPGALPAGSDHPPGKRRRLPGGTGFPAGGPGGPAVPGMRLASGVLIYKIFQQSGEIAL